LKKDKLRDQYNRGRIMGYLEANPRGVYFTDILKTLDMKYGTLVYHLNVLERERELFSRGERASRIFFARGTEVYGEKKKFWEKVEFFPSKVQQDIIDTIEEQDHITQTEIAKKLRVSKESLHYHIRKLKKAGVVQIERRGGCTFCSLQGEWPLADLKE